MFIMHRAGLASARRRPVNSALDLATIACATAAPSRCHLSCATLVLLNNLHPGIAVATRASNRIASAVAALPVASGMRVLEIGCGPGAAARELLRLWPDLTVVAIDRSATAIRQAQAASSEAIASGRLEFRCVSAEDFLLAPKEAPFDLAFALRVGALDGRHPKTGKLALRRIAKALSPNERLFIDGGNPLVELPLREA